MRRFEQISVGLVGFGFGERREGKQPEKRGKEKKRENKPHFGKRAKVFKR